MENDRITQIIREALMEGKVLGMKECLIALNRFIDIKTEDGLPENISRNELNVFMNQYIKCQTENPR